MSNTEKLYHRHILKSIRQLDKRRVQYLGYRLQFLQGYFKPIEHQIAILQAQINKQKICLETQDAHIQAHPDVLNIREEIEQYQTTQNFYSHMMDQYEKQSLLLSERNQQLLNSITCLKQRLKGSYFYPNEKYAKPKLSLPPIAPCFVVNKSQSLRPCNRLKLNVSSNIQTDSSQCSLPRIIKKKTKPYLNSSNLETSPKQNSQLEIQTKENESIQKKLWQLAKKFDRLEALFKECFALKKKSVQKSVSQLQGKLIKNKLQFLDICRTINQRKVAQQEHFCKLSGDEIMALLISFPWLARKLFQEWSSKRKIIVQLKLF